MSRFKMMFAIVCVCVMATTAWAAGPAGLLAEWNFDEGKGDVARDSSGNGHDAKIYGATWARHGDGFAISLDGFDDYVDCGESRSLGIGGPVSIEAWIRPMRKAHGESILFGEGFNTYVLTFYNGEQVYSYISSGGNGIRGSLTLDLWNHVAATFDGTQMSLWINGRQAASRQSLFKSYKAAGRFIMGTKGAPGGERFRGMLDKVRVYNRAISGEEVVAHFQAEKAEYLDLTWLGRVKVTPYYYLDRREMVVEADYKEMQPLKGNGRLEVTLSNKEKPKEVIQRRLIDQLPAAGLADLTLPCSDLAAGDYLVRVTLEDDHGAYPVEEFTFSHPQKPRPLISPAERVAPALPPRREPTPFGFKMGEGGGFTLAIKEASYPFESRISWPNGDFNRLTAGDEPYGKGEKPWKASVRAAGKDRYKVEARGDFYTIQREIGVFPTHVYVKDRYTNTTDQDLGLLIYNETPIKPGQVTGSWLSGYERRGRQAVLSFPHYSQSVFLTDANTGMGIIPMDDVYIVQAVPYVEWQGAAGVGTEKFALAPGKSYTLEWAIYPTGSGDYYDFINTFRKVENRISTVDGGLGFLTYSPRSRRQVPTKDFIENKKLKYGIIHCLSFAADDPEVSIEGIEFMDFPREMQLLKEQAAAIHKRHPGLKAVFHIAHSLYATNNPERFPDSKVILANGKQAIWGASEPYFSKKRMEEGWTWWIFYPTPGNSFHDAMMKSVDVMMDDMGFDGGFMDGFFAGYQGLWTYDRWDGHSAEIDLQTRTIRRKIGSVLLLSQPSMIEYSRKIRDKGGVVIGMHTVFTRSMANEKYIIFSDEATGPGLHLAPNMTALGGGRTEKGVYLNTLEKLSWGELFVPYGVPRGIGHDLTHPLLSARQFPMTFEEIRSGLVRGKERIVTMNSGVYGWPATRTAGKPGERNLHLVYKFDGRGAPVPNDFMTTVDSASVRTELEFGKNESAVIEPIPVTLEASTPVNVRVLQYDHRDDNLALKILLNGQGEATLDVFVGRKYLPGSDTYRVTTGGETSTITEEDGTLTVPLKLDGQVEVVIERADAGK